MARHRVGPVNLPAQRRREITSKVCLRTSLAVFSSLRKSLGLCRLKLFSDSAMAVAELYPQIKYL